MFKTIQTRSFTFSSGETASLLLHICLVSLLLWGARSPRLHHAVMRELNIEIMEPHANRQIVAQQKRIESVRSSEPVPQKQEPQETKPKTASLETPRVEPAELKIAQSENRSDSPDALHFPQTTVAPTKTSHGGGTPSRNGNSEFEQRPQAVGHQSNQTDLINAYISMLTKLVNSHLIYPKEVRKKRLEGVSQVSFVVTASGEIKPGSLQIKKSSGSAVLDSNALKTILSLAPFQRPPRELTISFGIEFAEER